MKTLCFLLFNNNYNNNFINKIKMVHNSDSIDFLCFDLARLPRSILFIFLTIITFVFFLVYGYMQELLYQLPGFENYSWYLTLVQFLLYSCFAFLESYIRNDRKRKYNFFKYFIIDNNRIITFINLEYRLEPIVYWRY